MTATERARAAYARIREVDRPEVWILLRDEEDVVADARAVDHRVAAGEKLPLAGLVLAVKDNIDVAGLATTAGSPDYRYLPESSATCVERLVAAGAIVLGKTNLDQFATGLVGTRSPYGAVRHAEDPLRISGGSSSGSAVAVALGIADAALGTDTAGSGRVPAALGGIVGMKPTLGLVPTEGVVPASRSFDAVSVFAADLGTATAVLGVAASGPGGRRIPLDARLAAPDRPVVAVPTADGLAELAPHWRGAFAAAVERLSDLDVEIVPFDVRPLLEAARLLYDGALVAERFQAVGAFLEAEPPSADPVVSAIIRRAADIPAHRFVADLAALDDAKRELSGRLAGIDALLLPTTTEHPLLAEVAASPVEVNRRLGTYTNFVNLLDLAAIAIPAGRAEGLPFGVTVVTRAFEDQVGVDIAARLLDVPPPVLPRETVPLAVFGAHLRGQPLNHQLVDAGARFAGEIATDDAYRLHRLATTPPKPGLVRRGAGRGARIEGELWLLPPAGIGRFLSTLPAPMTLGPVTLADGGEVIGFGCAADALEDAVDITRYGGWRNALAEEAG